MIFQKRAQQNCNLEFHTGEETIYIVHEYTCLGTRISSTGNFNISLEHLKEKALHALFSLRKHTNFSKLKPSLACKIFEAMISPIISYNSEIWGVYVKHDFKVTRPMFFFGGGGYHPTLNLSGIPTFTFVVSLTHRMDNI